MSVDATLPEMFAAMTKAQKKELVFLLGGDHARLANPRVVGSYCDRDELHRINQKQKQLLENSSWTPESSTFADCVAVIEMILDVLNEARLQTAAGVVVLNENLCVVQLINKDPKSSSNGFLCVDLGDLYKLLRRRALKGFVDVTPLVLTGFILTCSLLLIRGK
jgi:hypothetical protein